MDANAIVIHYEYIDGAHFFTPKDARAQGLCVASPDLATAYNEVTVQLTELLGTKIEPAVPAEQFSMWVEHYLSCIGAPPQGIKPYVLAEWTNRQVAW